ncbi:MAG TPA: thioredoxin fold domain-containing protein [Rhodocyclaceae bacterium]|nr:thioredoxin fold domain-containing protein [Rhodocyclaceae bacterium]
MWQPRRGGWLCLLCALILPWPALAAGVPPPLTFAADLAVDGRQAGVDKHPVVVLFSRARCGWCDKARREHLNAMAASPTAGALFRQVNMDSDVPLTDFSGQRTSHRDFARRYNIKMTPTLMFFAGDGSTLAGAIVGYRAAEFYGTLIEDAIEDSRNQLRSDRK